MRDYSENNDISTSKTAPIVNGIMRDMMSVLVLEGALDENWMKN